MASLFVALSHSVSIDIRTNRIATDVLWRLLLEIEKNWPSTFLLSSSSGYVSNLLCSLSRMTIS